MKGKLKLSIYFVLFFICQNVFALDLSITSTNETCTGNGSLTFVITNQVPSVPVFYSVYLLPNTTTPIVTTSSNSYNTLVAGSYSVIASQTVNGTETTVSQNAIILNEIIPLTFSITGIKVLCGNDGTITVSASATAVSYQILAGPVTTGVQASNVFTGLSTGVYNIRVVDNCGDGIVQAFTLLTATSSLQIFSANLVQILSCNSVSISHYIGPGNSSQIAYPLTVQTTIIPPSGSPTVSSQVVNSGTIFNLIIPTVNNQSYSYNLLITDACGHVYTRNNNFVSFIPIQISDPQIDTNTLSSCTSLNVLHTLTFEATHLFLYPISVQTTIYPPTGAAVVTNQSITSGTEIYLNIPMDSGVSYSYDVLITDACGNSYSLNNNVVTANFIFEANVGIAGCIDNVVEFLLTNFGPPYAINFISTPSGFNPSAYNSSYPGPYTSSPVYFGGIGNSLPVGTYVVEVVDGCGNVFQQSFVITPTQVTIVEHSSTPSGCGVNTGTLSLFFNPIKGIDTITLITAPSTYLNSLPENVSSFVGSNDVLLMENLPSGTYSFNLTDLCGNSYSHSVTIGVDSGNIFSVNRPGCNIGLTSVAISVQNSLITFIEIIQAPSTFVFPLPYNVSSNIASNGAFYMNSLPAGNYKFRIIDNCGSDRIYEKILDGLNIGSTNVTISEKCGAFDLELVHYSNGNYITSFWLQKFNTQDNVWEHPSTGLDYLAGSNLTSSNAVPLTNNLNNINLAYSGSFRIVKVFYTYSNGTSNLNRCITVINEFEFNGGPKIIDAYAFPCSNNTLEVVVVATGLPPLDYKITSKDGLPFIVNNNTSNTFAGLTPAIYNFRVEDVCGNFVNRVFNVTLLQEPEITASNLCNGNNGQLEIQDFPFVTYQWYNVANPSVILSTSNTLQFSPFNSATNTGTFAVQLSSSNANSCVNQTIQYEINSNGFNPNAGNNSNPSLCKENTPVDLNTFLSNPHDSSGVWTDSNNVVLTSTIINPNDYSAGDFIFNYTVTGFCAITDVAAITVTIKDLPAIPILTVPTPICEGNDVLLEANTTTNATYFWTGPNGFTSSEQNPLILNFTSINNGTYFVFITVDGCNSPTEQIVINSNPLPDFSIDGVTSICVGQNEDLTINATNFNPSLATIEWYFNNILLSTQTNPTLQINQIGIYKAIITSDGCQSENEVEVTEKINSFDVILEQGCNGNQYEISVINASDFPNATYSWSGPNGFVSFSQNIIVPNLEIGQYDVEVTDILGCKSNAFVVVKNTNCFISNAFSPDEDGYNDSFDLSGYNVKKIYVYNRYGRLVYDKDDYINEWKGQTNNNEKLPVSTYFYVLEFYEGENKTGWVYINY